DLLAVDPCVRPIANAGDEDLSALGGGVLDDAHAARGAGMRARDKSELGSHARSPFGRARTTLRGPSVGGGCTTSLADVASRRTPWDPNQSLARAGWQSDFAPVRR